MSSLARNSGESRSVRVKGAALPKSQRRRFGARRLGGLVNTGPLSFGT